MIQLSQIEPTGADLPRHAVFHARHAEQCARQADAWELRGSSFYVSQLEREFCEAIDRSGVCLSVFEFECLGGLQ